jgi:hypothetical protein
MRHAFRIILFVVAGLLPAIPVFALSPKVTEGINYISGIIDFINIVLLLTSLYCIKDVLFPGMNNRSILHLFNAIAIAVFFVVSLSFLISYKGLYDGYADLTTTQCIGKMFFSLEVSCIQQWFLVLAFVVNVIYVTRNIKEDNYLSGYK